jgi:uncharacterized protein YktB (UPF0637 family)
LERINLVTFPGFRPSDFDVFCIPDFAARMGAIRSELRPKLVALGEALAPELSELVPGPILPHTAAHMRRRTNPPPATWVAFGRSPKGYKRFVHFRVAASDSGFRVTVHVEDDSDDKASFAAALHARRDALLPGLAAIEELVWYTLPSPTGAPVRGRELTAAHLDQLSGTLGRLKTADFSAGIPFDRDDPRLASPTGLPPLLLASMRQLAPLYEAALPVGDDDLMT